MWSQRLNSLTYSQLTKLKSDVEGEFQSPVITSFEIGKLCDFSIPYLWFKDVESEQRVPFFGQVILKLSQEKFCTLCYQKFESFDGSRICNSCKESDLGKLFNCIWNGPRDIYGSSCNPNEVPLCGSFKNAQYCSSSHLLYIGAYGNLIKIGVTRERRGNYEHGYLNRLIEQGLDFAFVFHFVRPLMLPIAQDLEDDLSTVLGIRTKLTYNDKIQEILRKSSQSNHSRERRKISSLLRHITRRAKSILEDLGFAVSKVELIDLRDEEIIPPFKDLHILKDPDRIVGTIDGYKGNIVFLKTEDETFLINLHDLEGRRVYSII